MSLTSIVGSITRAFHRSVRKAGHTCPRKRPSARRQLELERLEAREMLSATVGMEVERVSDYMGGWMFKDAFQASRPWERTSNGNPDFSIAMDQRGNPVQLTSGQAVHTLMFNAVGSHYPGGTYTAWWQGGGTVTWGGDVNVASIQLGEATGSDGQQYHTSQFTVTPGRSTFGIEMTVTASMPIDNAPIHDVHVWMPDHNGQSFVGQMWQPGASFSPFHPLFLERLAPFRTLRFMDATATNESTVQHWGDRRPWNFATQMTGDPGDGFTVAAGFHQNGLAPEYMIALANELHANLWINIPHLADYAPPSSEANSYLRQMANLVHNTLDPNLRVYLEYSNEVWNPMFPVHGWVEQQSAGAFGSPEFARFLARQETRVFDVWSGVFSDRPGQLTRVLAGQQGNHDFNAQLLAEMTQLGSRFDAFSVAAYLFPQHYRANTTVNQVLADMRGNIASSVNDVRDARALADQYHVGFVAYEGGIAIETWNVPEAGTRLQDVRTYNRAAIDPRMYRIYSDFLNQLGTTRLDMFSNLQYTGRGTLDNPGSLNDQSGIWGALSYQDQPLNQAHKYRALLDFMAGTSTTLRADATAPVAGQTVTLTARVATNAIRPEVVSGTVRFYDGARLLGTSTVVNGVATLQIDWLRVGNHALRAIYDGDNSYTRSVGTLRLTVSRAAVDMTLISSVPESVFGQPITLTVQVAAAAPGSGTPTGVVTFRDGATVLRTVRLVDGMATFTTSALRVGARAISAVFSGDFRFLRANTDLTQTVNP